MVTTSMSLDNRGRVPWSDQLHRIHAGVPHKAEWMAPQAVLRRVRSDYLAASDWMQESVLRGWSYQWSKAAHYLADGYLKQYRKVLQHRHHAAGTLCVGVLRADHRVTVRHFSEDGKRCFVIDHQMQRRMATYDYTSQTRLHTQDMGDCAVVFQMTFDEQEQQWKIAAFVQQLPQGWDSPKLMPHIEVLAKLPRAAGRDN